MASQVQLEMLLQVKATGNPACMTANPSCKLSRIRCSYM